MLNGGNIKMRINYKNKVYELAELTEPNKNETFDIIAIFEVKPCKWVGTDLVECSNDECEFEKLKLLKQIQCILMHKHHLMKRIY